MSFITTRYTSAGTSAQRSHQISIETFDNSGTAAIRARRRPSNSSPQGAVQIIVYIVEFGSNVTVQSGSSTLSTTSATATISSVVQGNSFIVANANYNTAPSGGDWSNEFVQSAFNSNTQIAFTRRTGSQALEVYWYVVSSNGTDFNTEYVEYDFGTSEVGPTNINLSNSVTLANAFIVPSFELDGYTDRLREYGLNFAITSTTQLTFYRNHVSTPNRGGTAGVFVVRTNAAGADVQKIDRNAGGGGTTLNDTISSVDLDAAIIIDGASSQSVSLYTVSASTAGTASYGLTHTVDLTSSTNVQSIRQQNFSGGSGTNIRYEVVEFELETGGIEYTITADQGSFAFSGLDAKTVAEAQLSAEQGSFGFTGLDAKTVTEHQIAAEQGTFGFAGLDAGLASGQSLIAETGIYGFVGEDAELVAESQIAAETGAVGFAGLPAEFRLTDSNTLPAGAGGYAFDGQAVNFIYGSHLVADTGSFGFKGLPAQLPSDDKNYAGLPTQRKPKVKRRRYILPDNRVFEDAERALFELRRLLLSERQEQRESDGSEVQPVVMLEPTGAALEDLPSDYPSPTMMNQVLRELPTLVEARPEDLDPIDPQLLSVLLQMIDDEEAAMLLL